MSLQVLLIVVRSAGRLIGIMRPFSGPPPIPKAELTSSVQTEYLLYVTPVLNILKSRILFGECSRGMLKIVLFTGLNVFSGLSLGQNF